MLLDCDVVIDAETGRRAGGYLSRYARSHGVEIADALIAAAASTTGLHLWTLNNTIRWTTSGYTTRRRPGGKMIPWTRR